MHPITFTRGRDSSTGLSRERQRRHVLQVDGAQTQLPSAGDQPDPLQRSVSLIRTVDRQHRCTHEKYPQARVTPVKNWRRRILLPPSSPLTPPTPPHPTSVTLENYPHVSSTPREMCGLVSAWVGTKHRQASWLACCMPRPLKFGTRKTYSCCPKNNIKEAGGSR